MSKHLVGIDMILMTYLLSRVHLDVNTFQDERKTFTIGHFDVVERDLTI